MTKQGAPHRGQQKSDGILGKKVRREKGYDYAF